MFKNTVVGDGGLKFWIMDYRYMEYNSEGIFCNTSGNSTGKEKFICE